ncbi:FxsA family protein [Halioglobus pacificus]|uniref:Protein FxsA n=1 Tax=Parahalioglobus pacificus TaxID=930806 RepID=A0A918XLZ4_9GAMM|nr:FxsA family protein [Halioglobus pacificus]GHD37876.1 protein FxsA [Halioglobus pacificus]
MKLFLMLLPWLELFTLIQLGIETSALTALAYVMVTIVVGVMVLRWQGMELFNRLRETQQGAVLGPRLLKDDMSVVLAGLLLIVPGMISDIAAVIVLIGPLRRRLARMVFGPEPEIYAPERDNQAQTTIDGDFKRVDEAEKKF